MTLIIAHRGASAYAPENTLRAFELACQQRADMLELDVRRTSDDEIVVFHDATTRRWNGRLQPVTTRTLADLRQLDLGGERVATLAEVCVLARERGVMLNVELKQLGIAAQCAHILRMHGVVEQTVVSSFYHGALWELLQIAPEIQRAYLMGTQTYRPDVRARELWPFPSLRRTHATAWHPAHQLPLLPLILPRVRRVGYAVNVWTVDDPVMMRRLATLGATGIITNKPDVARRTLEGRVLSDKMTR